MTTTTDRKSAAVNAAEFSADHFAFSATEQPAVYTAVDSTQLAPVCATKCTTERSAYGVSLYTAVDAAEFSADHFAFSATEQPAVYAAVDFSHDASEQPAHDAAIDAAVVGS